MFGIENAEYWTPLRKLHQVYARSVARAGLHRRAEAEGILLMPCGLSIEIYASIKEKKCSCINVLYMIRYLYEGLFMVSKHLSEIPIVFYRTATGVEPVRDWLRGLPDDDRREIGFDLATVQVGWPVGMPLCRSLGDGIWEVRSSLPSRRIARILFFVHEGRIGIVNGFIKKTMKTPPDEIELARKRMKEMIT